MVLKILFTMHLTFGELYFAELVNINRSYS